MLRSDKAVLVVIDVQGKLARTVFEAERVLAAQQKLLKGFRLFQMPVIVTEQNPKGLGPTVPELAELVADAVTVEKFCFDACRNPAFMESLAETGRNQVLLCGIETHICVWQTAAGLLERGYEVQVISDAVSSRTAWNRDVALERMRGHDAVISTTEMALFEFMQAAEGELFRDFVRIVK